ncbi:MAG TPA: sugar phosphate isomerase [Planctomycetes bacterium]|nr:sugar phosphate isomerase [Planctomycetota bacterium]
MIIRRTPRLDLTYCLNIHPGETWRENFAAIRRDALRVRDLVAAGKPFGLGLRLSARAAAALADPRTLAELRAFLDAHGLYIFTINGFPYGRFHGARVKEKVYAPDWRTKARRDYTIALADILAALVPEGCTGSISTVPGSYKPWIKSDADVRAMAHNLADVAAHCARIRDARGADIALALEPEPDCFIETAGEAIDFLTGPLRALGAARLAKAHRFGKAGARAALRRHIGICLDTAHSAVEFEQPLLALMLLSRAGIRIPKVQVSAALRAYPDAATIDRLRPFCDPVYLHQVRVRTAAGRIAAFRDLPDAIAARTRVWDESGRRPDEEWRIHFHVPLFFEGDERLSSTSDLLDRRVMRVLRTALAPHLEIETYTFSVLPEELRAADVAAGVAREFAWLLARGGGRWQPLAGTEVT